MNPMIVVAADALVVVLLVATIATSVRLSKRIAQLKADDSALRATIGELVSSTSSAERAIAGLKATVVECDRTLAGRLQSAERYSVDLARAAAAGETVLERIDQFVEVTRRAVHGPAPMAASVAASRSGESLKAAVATAKVVAERAARRVESRAA